MHWRVVYSFADEQSLVFRAAVTSFVLRVGILAQRRGEYESIGLQGSGETGEYIVRSQGSGIGHGTIS